MRYLELPEQTKLILAHPKYSFNAHLHSTLSHGHKS